MAKTQGQKRRREAESDQEQKGAAATETGAPASKKARVEERRSLFVRSLPTTATNETLTEFFSQHYPVKHAMVVVDPTTKTSRGYGFVTFTDADDAVEAKMKLNGQILGGRRLRLDVAEPRQRQESKSLTNAVKSQLADEKRKREEEMAEARKPAKLIIRNLPWSIKESDQLASLFKRFGKIRFVDIPQAKGKLSGFGFVTFKARKQAQRAMEEINGKEVDGRTIAVDWAVSKDEWQKQQGDEKAVEEVKESKPEKSKKKETKAEDEDEEMKDADKELNEEEADVANFMRNHMQDLESEDEEDDDKEGGGELDEDKEEDDEQEEEQPEKPKRTTDNSTTLFIRNLSYTATDEALKEHFSQFGAIRYARVVIDRATERPAGTGFVCFFNVDEFKQCLRNAPRRQAAPKTSKPSVLQDETVDTDGRYTLDGRVLQVTHAVSKDEAARLVEAGGEARKGGDKDKRRIYLLSEGTIPKNSPLFRLLTPAEVTLREQSAQQRKKQIQSNPSLNVSLHRLAIRNLPRNIDSKALKALAREAVVGFATDVKEGKREPLSKEELARGGQEDKDAEQRLKEKGKGMVKQAKVVMESKAGHKVDEKTGAGKSRGYGFIEYSSHRRALMALRWLNGHPLKNEANKTIRLIVEFAIENAQVVQRRKANEDKMRTRGRVQIKDNAAPATTAGVTDKRGGKFVKGGKGEVEDAVDEFEDDDDEPVKRDAAEKLAQRQRIIGKKRANKKKSQARRG